MVKYTSVGIHKPMCNLDDNVIARLTIVTL